jgi:hypothetical protein
VVLRLKTSTQPFSTVYSQVTRKKALMRWRRVGGDTRKEKQQTSVQSRVIVTIKPRSSFTVQGKKKKLAKLI